MSARWSAFALLCLLLLTAAVAAASPPAASAAGEEPIPASLGKLYPPHAAAPVFLIKKIEMAEALSGIFVDLMEEDIANVASGYETFRSRYAEIAKLVPEWADRFPMAPVNDLGPALGTGDQGKVMAAFERVGATCAACHEANMAPVQHAFHWPRFREVTVPDPLTQETIDFARFMQYLEMSYAGITHSLRQGQPENARKHYEGFAARFGALSQTCGSCHETERTYFTDAKAMELLGQIGTALTAPQPDAKAVAAAAQGIGMETCHKCHLVHIPAAMTQARLAAAAPAPTTGAK